MLAGGEVSRLIVPSVRLSAVTAANPARTARAESASSEAAGSESDHHQVRYGAKKEKYVPLASSMNAIGRNSISRLRSREHRSSCLATRATVRPAAAASAATAASVTAVISRAVARP